MTQIKHGFLSDYFEGFGYKRLKPVEIDPEKSNEHEFNGIQQFKKLFGTEKIRIPTKVIYLSDDEDNIIEDNIHLTWYNAREKHATRTEYRLYYQSSTCFEMASAEDLLLICKNRDNKGATIFIARNGETVERQLAWLFGIDIQKVAETKFEVEAITHSKSLDYFSSLILEKIGINVIPQEQNYLDILQERFPAGLPTTRVFSEFARSLAKDVDVHDVDTAIVEWMDCEEMLFKTYEKYWVDIKLQEGFKDVKDFIDYSLSVHNRRKTRAGLAFENHLQFIFCSNGIKNSLKKITENKSQPDFIFPSIEQYHDSSFPSSLLTMLGVKTTCKDRWRQVLGEAERIPNKHLITLEPGISPAQTKGMKYNNIQLVVPKKIVPTYNVEQQKWLFTVSDFIELVKERQQ